MSSPLAADAVGYMAPPVFVARFEEWLQSAPPELQRAVAPAPSTDAAMDSMCALMQELHQEGWSRHGWPEAMGGMGGSILHRALMWEGLARHGVPRMAAFEHLEVLGPTLVAMAPADFVAATFGEFLDGTSLWCQGFSEPDAGSDLASLRTRAVPVEGGYLVTGRKIWTSWAPFARWSLVLTRTGTPESRHRGVTALIVDLRTPGIAIRRLSQANGGDELSEVTFDDVFVPGDRVVGVPDGGWAVAMDILGHERGTFAWFRHCFLLQQVRRHAGEIETPADGPLAEALLDLASVRALSAAAVRAGVDGHNLGPRAAFTKLLLCTAEQATNDWILATDDDLALDPSHPDAQASRAAYLFSRIVTIYGGSQQMQLDTIAKQVLRLP